MVLTRELPLIFHGTNTHTFKSLKLILWRPIDLPGSLRDLPRDHSGFMILYSSQNLWEICDQNSQFLYFYLKETTRGYLVLWNRTTARVEGVLRYLPFFLQWSFGGYLDQENRTERAKYLILQWNGLQAVGVLDHLFVSLKEPLKKSGLDRRS